MIDVHEVINAWQPYISQIQDWATLVEDMTPKPGGCGQIYEFPENLVNDRPDEDFCIADMRQLKISEPHYHPTDTYEIYFVLQGLGHIVVGSKVDTDIKQGDVLVMEPNQTHYTKPFRDLVLAVVNAPRFKPELYIPVDPLVSDLAVQFDTQKFQNLRAS